MKKKDACLIGAVPQILFLLTLLLLPTFTERYWRADTGYYGGVHTLAWTHYSNLFLGPWYLVIPILLSAVVGAVAMILQFFGKKEPVFKYLSLAPAGSVLFFVIETVVVLARSGETNGRYGYYEFSLAWGFFIQAVLLLAALVMGILIMTGKLKEAPPKPVYPYAAPGYPMPTNAPMNAPTNYAPPAAPVNYTPPAAPTNYAPPAAPTFSLENAQSRPTPMNVPGAPGIPAPAAPVDPEPIAPPAAPAPIDPPVQAE